MRTWITDYITGCTTCQQNKILTHRQRTPIYCIPTSENALLFQHISLDLITQLSKSQGHDTVLTIVDHSCTCAAIFLPCSTTVTGPGIAQLYLNNVYRSFSLPSKLISDRDTHFMSPAPGVGSQPCLVCLQTRISLGNQPMFDTKSRKYRAPLEGPAGTEYIEDATLEQCGKA